MCDAIEAVPHRRNHIRGEEAVPELSVVGSEHGNSIRWVPPLFLLINTLITLFFFITLFNKETNLTTIKWS